MENYPWYATIEGNRELAQGDFIQDCPIVIPPSELIQKEIEVNIETYNVIIMTQSCDEPNFETDHLIVDFRNVYAVSFKLIKRLAQKTANRLRLLSPYRDHLSQAFARFFMRVGLPADIPPFK